MAPEKLTEKQRRFVEAFMGKAAGNATEAARLAGYRGTDNTLRVVGAENLSKPAIAAAVSAIQQADPLIADRNERQRFWTDVMRGVVEDHKVVTEDGIATVIPVPASLPDRLRAAELLAKASGDFVKIVQHGGTVTLRPEDRRARAERVAHAMGHALPVAQDGDDG